MIIARALFRLKHQFSSLGPARLSDGVDNNPARAFASWFVDPGSIFIKIPGKLIGMVFINVGLI